MTDDLQMAARGCGKSSVSHRWAAPPAARHRRGTPSRARRPRWTNPQHPPAMATATCKTRRSRTCCTCSSCRLPPSARRQRRLARCATRARARPSRCVGAAPMGSSAGSRCRSASPARCACAASTRKATTRCRWPPPTPHWWPRTHAAHGSYRGRGRNALLLDARISGALFFVFDGAREARAPIAHGAGSASGSRPRSRWPPRWCAASGMSSRRRCATTGAWPPSAAR